MCSDKLSLAGRDALVPDTYAAGGDITGDRTTGKREYNIAGEAAHPQTFCPVYYHNLLVGNSVDGVPVAQDNVYLCINSCAYL